MNIKLSLSLVVATFMMLPFNGHAALLSGDEIYISFDNSSTNFTDGLDTWDRISFSSTQQATAAGGTDVVLESDLVNTSGVGTGVGFTMVDPMNSNSNSGVTSGSVWPDAAATDYWFGDNNTHSGTTENGLGIFEITGLDQGLSYTFDIFASRSGSGAARETLYTMTGVNAGNATLNVYGNVDSSVLISSITPDANGTITMRLESGASNSTSQKYYYINAMKITAIPEPSSILLMTGALGLFMLMNTGRSRRG